MGWTVGVSSAHFNQHKKCANARFSLFFFFSICIFRFLWQVISTSSGVFPGTGIDLQFVLILNFNKRQYRKGWGGIESLIAG